MCKNLLQDLENFHMILNRKGTIPDSYYRRNHVFYPLVCYINTIIGLYLSSNFEAIPLFIKRASDHMEKYENAEINKEYYRLVMDYLFSMAKYLSIIDIDRKIIELIPAKFTSHDNDKINKF